MKEPPFEIILCTYKMVKMMMKQAENKRDAVLSATVERLDHLCLYRLSLVNVLFLMFSGRKIYGARTHNG